MGRQLSFYVRTFLAVLVGVVAVLVSAITPRAAYAAEVVHSGTIESLNWSLDDEGTLTLTGELDNSSSQRAWEWTQYGGDIRHVSWSGATLRGNLSNMFGNCSALESFSMEGKLENVTDFTYFFGRCTSLTNATVIMSSGTGVESANAMFYQCSALTYFNVMIKPSNVKPIALQAMFYSACPGDDKRSIGHLQFRTTSSWLASDRTKFTGDFVNMFSGCRVDSLTIEDMPLANGAQVEKMQMKNISDSIYLSFYGERITSSSDVGVIFARAFNSSLSKSITLYGKHANGAAVDGDLPYVFSMSSMCTGSSYLETLKILDIRTRSGYGRGCACDNMCSYCPRLRNVDGLYPSSFTKGITTLAHAFENCDALVSITFVPSGFEDCVDMSYMFNACDNFRSFTSTFSPLDNAKVVNLSHMFAWCTAYNMNALTLSNMFRWSDDVTVDCSNMFEYSGVERTGIGNVGNARLICDRMFYGCYYLKDCDIDSMNSPARVKSAVHMFSGCGDLEYLDLHNWAPGYTTDISSMFVGTSLRYVYLPGTWTFFDSTVASLPGGEWIRVNNQSSVANISDDEFFAAEGNTSLSNVDLMLGFNSSQAGWWARIPASITVSYDANGGDGAMAPQKFYKQLYDEYNIMNGVSKPVLAIHTLSDSTMHWFDHEFLGWNTKPDGSGISFANEVTVTIDGNLPQLSSDTTLYAQWRQYDHEVELTDGEFMVDVPAGVKLSIDDLPAGMGYQVFEETADGWRLVSQTDSVGQVVPEQMVSAAFVNQYVPGVASAQIVGTKTLDGYAPADGQFTFELVENGQVLQTVTNGSMGSIVFAPIEYDRAGNHVYVVREVQGEDDTVTYDGRTFEVRVNVADRGGTLRASVSYPNGYPTFENKTNPGSLTLKKIVEGQTNANKDDEFTFTIRLTNPNGQSLDEVHMTKR